MKQTIEIKPLADYYVVVVKDKVTGKLMESFTLNESAAKMLQLFCEGKDFETVTKEIAKIYEAPLELITKDVLKLTDKLKQKKLL